MKPKNFPERRRQRLIAAEARLRALIVSGPIMNMEAKDRIEAELRALMRSTAKPQRDVRTKKDRTDRAKFRRAA